MQINKWTRRKLDPAGNGTQASSKLSRDIPQETWFAVECKHPLGETIQDGDYETLSALYEVIQLKCDATPLVTTRCVTRDIICVPDVLQLFKVFFNAAKLSTFGDTGQQEYFCVSRTLLGFAKTCK